MANCNNTFVNIPKVASGPTIPGFGQLSAFNGPMGELQYNVEFKLQELDPEPKFLTYKDVANGSGSDGFFEPDDGYGNIKFSSQKVAFPSTAKKLIILSDGVNEGTYDILNIYNGYIHIVRDNNPAPPPDLNFLFKIFSLKLQNNGELRSPLNPNYGKDAIDSIIKLYDQFMPFLMTYKFFLPILKLILCILEVFCAMPNPIKIAAAMQRLFRDCVPLFLGLFPIIALILMIINILVLLVQLILYLILLITNMIELIIRNILILDQAIERADAESILAAAAKIGRILCLLQNLFVVLLMVNLIFQIFKDLIKSLFAIPPCDSSENSSFQNCCTPDVCPQFIKNGDFERSTGNVMYISACQSKPEIIPPGMESVSKYFSSTIRSESFQFYDDSATTYQELINIQKPNDPSYSQYATSESTIFFPTDSSYTKDTPPNQSPYLVDIKFLYKPASFGRSGDDKYVIFKDCIVINPTSVSLEMADGSAQVKPKGVVKIAGGKGFEEDGSTKINGYDNENKEIKKQATLETFIFLEDQVVYDDVPKNIENKDFINFSDLQYTFKINHKVLVSKGLITYSCLPEINQDRTFTNNVFSNDLNLKIAELQNFPFPDIEKSISCMNLAIDAFRNNLTIAGAETLKVTAISCLQQLKQETEDAINLAIPLAFDQYKSEFSISPSTQFTTDVIKVNVDLKESSGTSLANLLPQGTSEYIAKKIIPSISLGKISEFTYNGTSFEAEISSQSAGSGDLEVAFDNKKISNITPEDRVADLSTPLTISTQKLNYQFIYVSSKGGNVSVGTGDSSDGSPIRDDGDVSRLGSSGGVQ